MVDRGIRDGDLLVVRRGARVEDGEVGMALIGEEATVKTVRRTAKGVVLEPENRARGYAPLLLKEGDEARLLGKAVCVFRRL
jgi:repressor LexA